MKIEIKSIFGSILFEHEKENNSIKDTLMEAIKSSANLRYADLSSANLSYADLRYADLSYADLRYADLSYADLSSANLSYADLRSANLRSANLRSADLRSANLSYAKTDKRYIQIGCIGSSKRTTTYCFEDNIIWCGCFKGTIKEFENQCKKTHKNNKQYLKEYIGFINYLKSLR